MPRKDKVNILYVFGGEKAQGAEIVIERLMSINKDEVNAHLILSPGKFADELMGKDVPYQVSVHYGLQKLNRISSSKFSFYSKALRNYLAVSHHVYKYVKRHNIDAVHANTIVPASYLLPALMYAKLTMPALKWLWSDHDMRYFSALENKLAKICLSNYDHTIVVSNAVKQKYNDHKKVVVLYNGLDIHYFKPDERLRQRFRTNQKVAPNQIVIGMAAVITPDKGQLDLINAFKSLTQRVPDLLLILAGGFATDTPDYSDEVRKSVQQNNNVKYLGYVENMLEFYNGCDVIVNNSSSRRSESLGTTIYEAMACQKVLVASDTGGTPEIITDGVDGYLFKTEDIFELENALEKVSSNYLELESVREAAREKVESKFDINIMAENYNIIVDKLINKRV